MSRRPKAESMDPDVPQANHVTVGMCDFCPSVHVNLHDASGTMFASASIACGDVETFIGLLRSAAIDRALRMSAPEGRQ